MRKADNCLTSGIVCEAFGIAKNTLYTWERKGEIPPVPRRDGRTRCYSDSHLSAIRTITSGDSRFRDSMKRLVQAPETPDTLDQMESLLQRFSVHKIGTDRLIGLVELNERQSLQSETIHGLIEITIRSSTPMGLVAQIVSLIQAKLSPTKDQTATIPG